MIVAGLIVTLVGLSALALSGRGGEGAALANAQTILSGLVGATRGQAALHQTNARLLIYAQQPPTGEAAKYLRYLQVVREEPFESNLWVAAGPPITLPDPVCVVPPSPVPATHLNTGVTWKNNAATDAVSVFPAILRNFRVIGQSVISNGKQTGQSQLFGGTTGGSVYYLEFDPAGTVSSNKTANPTKIALSTAVLNANTVPRFNNANAARGVIVRKSGAITLIDDATGF